MEWLSEDPTYLAGGLGVLALIFLVALRGTQQGKYLIWAGIAIAAALVVVLVEHLWVTDNERIERVVYEIADAARESDAAGVLKHLTENVQYGVFHGEPVRSKVESGLEETHFDFLRIRRLSANAGGQSRRGTAEFEVLTGGTYGHYNFTSTNNIAFSLGFEEASPGVWKVSRITPTRFPRYATLPMPGGNTGTEEGPTRSFESRPYRRRR